LEKTEKKAKVKKLQSNNQKAEKYLTDTATDKRNCLSGKAATITTNLYGGWLLRWPKNTH
jgi:hypothetical protein